MRYRRPDAGGATWFFTVNLADRKQDHLISQVDTLREVIARVKRNHPFTIDAIVIMPDHLHAIWTLPENDADFSMRWGLIKAGFSRSISSSEFKSKSRQSRGERGIWQRRFWEHQIRDEKDLSNHVDYIHFNPVKHGYVKNPVDWQHSSIHRFIKNGTIQPTWGADLKFTALEYGERNERRLG